MNELDEHELAEKERLESTDIYKISARIRNHVSALLSLTPIGIIFCNEFTHVMKELYDFGDSLEKSKKNELRTILKRAEKMPSKVIELANKANKKNL